MLEIGFETNRGSIQLVKLPRFISLFLIMGDIFGLFVCLGISSYGTLDHPLIGFDLFVYGFILLTLTGMYLLNTYHPEKEIAGLQAPTRILISSLIVAIITSVLINLSGNWEGNSVGMRGILLVNLGIFTIWAMILRIWAFNWWRSQAQQSRWLMLGANNHAIKFAQMFLTQNPLGRLVILTETGQHIPELAEIEPQLSHEGSLNDLSYWSHQPLSGVVVGTQISLSDQQVQSLMQLRLKGIPVYRLPDIWETLCYKLPSSLLEDEWFAFSSGFNLVFCGHSLKIKGVMDIIVTGLLSLLVSPLMIFVGLIIKLDSPGPIFYSQLRTGLYGKPFRVYKFRSMYQDAEKRGAQWASQRDPRITRVGYWLRVLRIDELPQIWNVLRGEMSLIGPRPERPEFDVKLKEAIPYYEMRYLVKPGITGWAQVLYPYGASLEDAYEKLSYDLYYIKNYSLWLDMVIVLKTIRVVLLGKGR
ncbi:sugar transferase [Anabaena sp. 54]|uniref:Sugar transferase n=2 Tax=Dolichospermum flosaquae TaxID=1166 RepID=A0ACC7S6I7_DOLFA|nr:sugar transferase [Anabaena sp. 54]MBO1064766.1 sugar transferase [Anabaena sp. 54]MTJ43994.1 sugar transferase [Dolichospermum flos-aquae UHCC 0037]